MEAAPLAIGGRYRVGQDLLTRQAVELEPIVRDLFAALAGFQQLDEFELTIGLEALRWARKLVAALHIVVADDRRETGASVQDLGRVRRLLDAHPLDDRTRAVGRIGVGGQDNGLRRHPRYLLDPRRRVFRGPFPQVLEPVAPPVDELAIVFLCLDDPVNHSEEDGGIGSRSQLHPHIRNRGDFRASRVEGDQLGTMPACLSRRKPVGGSCDLGLDAQADDALRRRAHGEGGI